MRNDEMCVCDPRGGVSVQCVVHGLGRGLDVGGSGLRGGSTDDGPDLSSSPWPLDRCTLCRGTTCGCLARLGPPQLRRPGWETERRDDRPAGGPWTSHGHAVEGVTVAGSGRPSVIARCGGPAFCGVCGREAAQIRASRATPPVSPAEWERFDYEGGETIWQRTCPDCDGGLIYAPVRFCGRCGGDGYITRRDDPDDPKDRR